MNSLQLIVLYSLWTAKRARNDALCSDEGIGVVPWSPLARGRLTRAWNEATERTETDRYGSTLYLSNVESDRQVVERVAKLAAARGVPQAQVALVWMAQKPFVTAPIVGASKPQHLTDAPYVPHATTGHA